MAFEYPPLPADLCAYKWGGNGIANRVYRVLGAGAGRKLPAGLKGKFNVDGHTVYVFKSRKTPKLSRKKRYFHRMFFRIDGRLVPTGRVQQALKCSYVRGRYR